MARDEGSYIRRSEDKKYIILAECERWPDGAIIAFHGWCDLQTQMERLLSSPKDKVA
jgi:hypothetical protein